MDCDSGLRQCQAPAPGMLLPLRKGGVAGEAPLSGLLAVFNGRVTGSDELALVRLVGCELLEDRGQSIGHRPVTCTVRKQQ